MIFRKVLTFAILILSIGPIFSQIVDDSTKVIYGTTTTKVFDQSVLYKEERIFFNKDTLFTRPFIKLPVQLPLNYKRPKLFTDEELKLKKRTDSIAVAKADSIKKTDEIKDTANEVTYYKKDTIVKVSNKKIKNIDPEKIYQSRFYKNYYKYYKPDTTLDDLQQYNQIYVNKNIYQNLGILGTATKPVFYTQPDKLGYQAGFNSYDHFYEDPSKQKYYNSRSAYTNFYYANSTGGEDRIRVEINRNITRNWNVGFSYNRISSDKLIGLSSIDQRGLNQGQNFIIYTSLKSKNERYHFLAHFNYFIHRVNEQGGLSDTANIGGNTTQLSPDEAPRQVSSWPVNLVAPRSNLNPFSISDNIFSRDRRIAYHIYHQYDVWKQGRLVLFHELDRRNQKFTFADPTINRQGSDVSFYKGNARYNDSTFFNYEFAYLTNKVGVKASLGQNIVLIGFYKNRNVFAGPNLTQIDGLSILSKPAKSISDFFINDPLAKIKINENYFGGEGIIKLRDSIFLDIKGELMLNLFNNSDNQSFKEVVNYKYDHQLEAVLNIKNFQTGISRMQNAPTLLQTYSMMHNNYYWWKSLAAVQSNNAYLKYKFSLSNHHFEVNPSFTIISNYTYFDSTITPQQLNSGQELYLSTLNLTYKTNIWKIHFDLFGKYSGKYGKSEAVSVIRFPEYYGNAKVYLKIVPRSKRWKQEFRFGFDFFYRSAYYGDAYMPSISQFYVQDRFKLNNNVLIDFFASAKMLNARIFFKVNQINQLLQWTNGYYISPYYPGVQGSVAFGFNWLLFDN